MILGWVEFTEHHPYRPNIEILCNVESVGHAKNLCVHSSQISKVDCRDALEMICNLESDGDEKGAFTLCSAFLTCQLLQGETYCAWWVAKSE